MRNRAVGVAAVEQVTSQERWARAERIWRWQRWLRAAVATALVSGAAAGSAHGYVVEGKAWPGHVITYHNAFPADAEAVAAAVADWNDSGAHLRFQAAPAGRAEVTIEKMPAAFTTVHLPGGHTVTSDALGYATVGRMTSDEFTSAPSGAQYRGAHVWLLGVGSFNREFGIRVRLSEGEMARVAVHELGHVLGLGHQLHGCATMEPGLGLNCTPPDRPWLGLCADPLEPDDIRGAVALYGGKEPKGPVRRCSLFALPDKAHSVAVNQPAKHGGRISVSWIDPAGLTLAADRPYDAYSLSGKAAISEYRVTGSSHGCPKSHAQAIVAGPATAGAAGHTRLALAPGLWCLALQIGDRFGRWGPATSLKVTVAPRPVPPAPQYPPTAEFSAPDQLLAGEPAAFTDDSAQGSAPITQRHWSFGDGASSTAANPTHTYASAGTYTVTLTVIDANGKVATTSQTVVVESSIPPQAGIDASSEVSAGADASFTDGSLAGSSPIVGWSWSFGDGATSSDENPDHSFTTPGTYTVTLTVTAQDGEQGSTSQTITVDPS